MIPPEGVQFLRQLKRNNNREWFQARKEIFDEKLRAPMELVVDQINSKLAGFAPEYVTDVKKAVFRIYRDTRFSKDKTPYKIHLGALFPKRGMAKLSGGSFYFHVAPEGVVVAGGVYFADPKALLQLRNHLSEHHSELEALLKPKGVKTMCGELHGEGLSRPPKGFPADHPAINLIKKKQWYFDVTLDAEEATKPAFAQTLVKRFQAMLPVVEFLNRGLAPTARPQDRLR
ncbi:MAG: DUF2461 domain-containing protein [Acidobacteriota bacterium]